MKTIAELRAWCAENPDELICEVRDLTTYGDLNIWRYAIARVIHTRTGHLIDALGDMPRGRDILVALDKLNADAAVQSVANEYRPFV